MINADKSVLDRELSQKGAESYNFALNLLNEILDYGTNLLPKALDNSPRDLKALCLVGVQFRQILVHLDGITLLARAGNCFSATLQLRSLMEICLAMEWILKSDTSVKLNHLYVSNLRRRKHGQSLAIPGSQEAIKHPDEAKQLSKLPIKLLDQIKIEVDAINKALSDSKFLAIDSKFQVHYAKNGYDKAWYEVYGTRSIRKIAEELNKLSDYHHFYRTFSEIAHGGSILKNLTITDEIKISPLRDSAKIVNLAGQAIIFTLPTYLMVLKEYLPTEIDDYRKLYNNEWRTRYLKTIPGLHNATPFV